MHQRKKQNRQKCSLNTDRPEFSATASLLFCFFSPFPFLLR